MGKEAAIPFTIVHQKKEIMLLMVVTMIISILLIVHTQFNTLNTFQLLVYKSDSNRTSDDSNTYILPMCDWYQYDNNNQILWPRGNSCCTPQEFVDELKILNDNYRLKNETYKLTSGSLLHTIVGGNWSFDNDLDFERNESSQPLHSLCVCIYDTNITALCSKTGFNETLEYIGPTWWIPLPLTKNIVPLPSPYNIPGAWYALYYDFRSKWNCYHRVYEHWAVWRQSAIDAIQTYDGNKDGNIDLDEFLKIVQTKVNQEWLKQFMKTKYCDFLMGYMHVKILNEILPEIQENVNDKKPNQTVAKLYKILEKYINRYNTTYGNIINGTESECSSNQFFDGTRYPNFFKYFKC
eukprot:79051_1